MKQRRAVPNRGAPLFEACVRGPPVSAQSRSRNLLKAWQATVAGAARAAWPSTAAPIRDAVTVTVSEFSEAATMDRDNMVKPILDSPQEIVYENDRQVMRVDVEWADIDGSFTVRYMSPSVALALSAGDEFIWIRVWPHSARKDLR